MKLKQKTKMYKKTLLFTALLGMGMILSSCFVDYGLDSENYDIVATSYNSSYDFGAVTKFAGILADSTAF
jgi:hypothetical protein